MMRLDEVRDAVVRAVVDEYGAQQRLLGLARQRLSLLWYLYCGLRSCRHVHYVSHGG
jgi:hypothetical protein